MGKCQTKEKKEKKKLEKVKIMQLRITDKHVRHKRFTCRNIDRQMDKMVQGKGGEATPSSL